MPQRLRRLAAIVVVLLAHFAPLKASAAESWVFQEDSVSLSIGGRDCVDPYAEATSGGDRIYAPCAGDVPAALSVYDCSESGVCARATLRSKMGKSFTKVKLTDGTFRGYYVQQDFGTCTNTVETGIMATDGLDISGVTKTNIQQHVDTVTIKDASGKESRVCKTEAWGVPDAVMTPEGKVRIYIVEEVAGATPSDASQKKCAAVDKNKLKRPDGSAVAVVPPTDEVIASYTSTDATGTTFVKDAGYRFAGGYVDPEILQATTGSWISIVSTGPGCEGQQYFVGTSTDGLNWKIASSALNGLSVFAGDPTGYSIGTNKFRIYYWTSPYHMGTGPATGFTLRRGTLEFKQVAASAPTSNKTTITCIKGKATKKVVGVNPKCPAGYKKK